MQSRRDQVEAHNYLLARLNSALVRADPDSMEPPGRRDTRAFLAGLVVAVLCLAGVAGWALFFDSGSLAWKEPGTLLVDKTSGSRYLLLDNRLRPVLNLSSARLAVGSGLKTASVSSSKLSGLGRGTAIGIPGAPDMLPALGLLNDGVWRSCLAPVTGAANATAVVPAGTKESSPKTDSEAGTLGVNVQLGVQRSTDRIGDETGFLVTSDGHEYLIWNGQHLLVKAPWVTDVLGYATVAPLKVSGQWLGLLPAGPALEPVKLTGQGKAGPKIGGRPTKVGQLFTVATAGSQTHYVVTRKGLAALGETQYALASAGPGTGREHPITTAELAAVPRDVLPAAQQDLPATPPRLDQSLSASSPCIEYPGTGQDGSAEVVRASVAVAERPVAATAATPAVSVSVPAGGGALVGTVPNASPNDQALTLIDDSGTAFALIGDSVTALGYSATEAVYVPARWLQLLPRGPRLTKPGEG